MCPHIGIWAPARLARWGDSARCRDVFIGFIGFIGFIVVVVVRIVVIVLQPPSVPPSLLPPLIISFTRFFIPSFPPPPPLLPPPTFPFHSSLNPFLPQSTIQRKHAWQKARPPLPSFSFPPSSVPRSLFLYFLCISLPPPSFPMFCCSFSPLIPSLLHSSCIYPLLSAFPPSLLPSFSHSSFLPALLPSFPPSGRSSLLHSFHVTLRRLGLAPTHQAYNERFIPSSLYSLPASFFPSSVPYFPPFASFFFSSFLHFHPSLVPALLLSFILHCFPASLSILLLSFSP